MEMFWLYAKPVAFDTKIEILFLNFVKIQPQADRFVMHDGRRQFYAPLILSLTTVSLQTTNVTSAAPCG